MAHWLRQLALLASLLALISVGGQRAAGQIVTYCPTPVVSYYAAPAVSYYAAPAVTYYSPPVVSYAAPVVSYYRAPAVSYYAAPAVSYYAPATTTYYPTTATTYRYGLLPRRQVTVTNYGTVTTPAVQYSYPSFMIR